MIPSDFCFANPFYAKLFFGCLVLLSLFFYLFHYRKKRLDRAWPFKTLRNPILFWLQVMSLFLAWCFLTLTWMAPQGNRQYFQPQTVVSSLEDVVFLIDASKSMSLQDTISHLSRLEFAKEIVKKTIQDLPQNPIALDAFTSVVTPLVPATLDHLFFRFRLEQIRINEGDIGGTDLVEALRKIKKPQKGILILLSDGGDNRFEKGEKELRLQAIRQVLEKSVLKSWDVLVIGIGEKNTPSHPIQEEPLQEIVSTLKGKILFKGGESAELIAKESAAWIQNHLKKKNISEASGAISYDHYFQIPLLLACLFLLCTRIRGGLFTLFFLTTEIFGDELFQAKHFFEAQEFSLAKDLLQKQLESSLSPWERAVTSYDLGLVLMQEGDLEGALEAFLEAKPSVTPPFPWFDTHREEAMAWLYLELGFLERAKKILTKGNLPKLKEKFESTSPAKITTSFLPKENVEEMTPPVAILTQAIQELLISIEMQKKAAIFGDVSKDELLKALEKALSAITPFQKQALLFQEKLHLDEPALCLKSPWDEVFPLVEDGILLNKKALQTSEDLAFFLQKRALKKWVKALQLLKQKESGKTPETPQNELFQRVKEMEILDHSSLNKTKAIQNEDEW